MALSFVVIGLLVFGGIALVAACVVTYVTLKRRRYREGLVRQINQENLEVWEKGLHPENPLGLQQNRLRISTPGKLIPVHSNPSGFYNQAQGHLPAELGESYAAEWAGARGGEVYRPVAPLVGPAPPGRKSKSQTPAVHYSSL